MQEIIDLIINRNRKILGENLDIKRIPVGFTNTIYSINDSFIIKICTDYHNEENFKKEIDFYRANENNDLIPKLYYVSTDKGEVPYFYEIIEKVKGVSLYNVWHTFSEEQREEIIKQLCTAMKKFHSNIGQEYDWLDYWQKQFASLYAKAKELSIFTEDELQLIDYAYAKFDRYLKSDHFVLVHNDLHFDNIFYKDGKITLIDFERSIYAPKDFELGILFRMIRKPWKFASEGTEQYTNSSDYTSIKLYIEKYYPELINTLFLSQRLAIYDMVYFLKQLVENPREEELKKDVIDASKIVSFKDELRFEEIKSASELMDYMDINIEYGWIDKLGNRHLNNLKGFRENYRISSIHEILKTGIGTCIEQAKLIKLFFDKMGLETKLYCHRGYETADNFDKEVRMHCFVLFKYQDAWYHFEHSNFLKRGIHKYHSVESAIKNITSGFHENDIRILTEIPEIPEGMSFKQFNEYVNSFEPISTYNHSKEL